MMMGLWREGLLYPIKNIKMRIKVLKSIFVRDLKKLKSEIESYKNEKNIPNLNKKLFFGKHNIKNIDTKFTVSRFWRNDDIWLL